MLSGQHVADLDEEVDGPAALAEDVGGDAREGGRVLPAAGVDLQARGHPARQRLVRDLVQR